MFLMNNGPMLHTLHGTIQSGLNEVDDKLWSAMEKDLKKHLAKPEKKGEKSRLEKIDAPKKGESSKKVKPSPQAEKESAEEKGKK